MQQIKYLTKLFLLSFSMSFLLVWQAQADDLGEIEKLVTEFDQAIISKDTNKLFALANLLQISNKPKLSKAQLKQEFAIYIKQQFGFNENIIWQKSKIVDSKLVIYRKYNENSSINFDEYHATVFLELSMIVDGKLEQDQKHMNLRKIDNKWKIDFIYEGNNSFYISDYQDR